MIISVTSITKLVERPVVVERSPEESPASNPQLETVQSTSTPVQQPKTTSQTTPQFVSQSSNSETVSVGINLQERCWLKVMVDGQVAFEGTLPQGTQRQWTGKKQVTIKAGNAGGVVISFNNEQQKIFGCARTGGRELPTGLISLKISLKVEISISIEPLDSNVKLFTQS